MLRSQRGNNNAWCQDNPIGWFDWSLPKRNAEMLRFVRGLIALRKRHPSLRRRRFLSGQSSAGAELPDIAWHGTRLDAPGWDDPTCRVLAFTLARVAPGGAHLHVVINMSEKAQSFELPNIEQTVWYRAMDTGRASPMDLLPPTDQPVVKTNPLLVLSRSVVVLEGR